MKKTAADRLIEVLVLVGLLAFGRVALAQQKFSLTQRASPAPGGAAGDMYYASSTTAITRLGIGTDGYCLIVSPTTHLPVWDTCPGGGVSGGSSGKVAFWTGTSTLSNDSTFLWDNTNKYLGIGGTPYSPLWVERSTGATLAGLQSIVGYATITEANPSSAITGIEANGVSTHTSGSVISLNGVRSRLWTLGSGGTTAGASNYTADADVDSGAIVTTRYGLTVADANVVVGGSILNQYGVNISTLSAATNNYSIYTGTTQSYFGGNVGIGTTAPGSKLVVSANAATLPAAPTYTVARFANADTNATRVLIDSFGTAVGPNLTMRGAGGTGGTPSATPDGNPLGTWAIFGYGSTGYSSARRAAAEFKTAEAWTDAAQGTYFTLETTQIGTTTTTERLRVTDSGNVGIGVTPSYALHVQKAIGATGAANTMVEALSNATTADANGRTAIVGDSWATHSSGTIGGLTGFGGNVYAATSGGTVTTATSIAASGAVNTGATIGTRTGLQVYDATGGGTLTTQYGLKIENLTKGATNYSIYSGTAQSYFGGNVGIGDTTPAQALDVYDKFQVDSNGNVVKLRNVTTSFPSSNAQGVLTNNGSGTLSWEVAGSGPGSTAGMRVLKETVFADLGTQTFTNGNTYTLDGSDYRCVCTSCGGSTIEIAASGLRFARTTTAGGGVTQMIIDPTAAGDNFSTIVGEARLRRGRWGVWVRLASYDYSTAGTNAYGGMNIGVYPKWGFATRSRSKNTNGTPNTSTGGIAFDHWLFGSDTNPTSYPGVSTADVILVYVSSFNTVEVYYGTYSGGWPDMDAMTYMGRVPGAATWIQAATSNPASAAGMSIWFDLGGANATSGTYEHIYDRWRITSWD